MICLIVKKSFHITLIQKNMNGKNLNQSKEKEIYKEQVKGKPEEVVNKILEGKIAKYFEETCLMDQPFIKDEKVRIKEYLSDLVGKIKENIMVRRFIRFRVGEEI